MSVTEVFSLLRDVWRDESRVRKFVGGWKAVMERRVSCDGSYLQRVNWGVDEEKSKII